MNSAAQRLDQLEVHVVGQAADVVVALDLGGVAGARLDDVGVERALHEEAGVGRCPPAASSKTRMNSSPMVLRLSSGSVTPGEALEEPVGGPHVDELDALVAAEGLDDLLALALAHEAGVDEHAGELGADGLVHEGGGHRRVDAAGQAADDPPVADLRADGLDLGRR